MPDSFGKHDATCECMGSGDNITYGSLADETSTNIANHANGEALRPDGDGTHFVRGVHPGRMAEYADGVINGNVPNVEIRNLNGGRRGFWDPDKSAVVIVNGNRGTMFTPKAGRKYFDEELN
ncbi:hypothetical protein [Streptomyces sp. NBC_00280]|uniref:hypothetical protein n=1 Tax=Streptomyces sp. NBC_00280 TaxID=2975699 RepID=UPI003247C1D7